MSTPETELQPEPPTGLVENEGVDAGELGEQDGRDAQDAGDAAAARAGGNPDQAGEQVQRSAAGDQMTDPDDPDDDGEQLAGAPDPSSEAGGQDSGSLS